MLADGIATSRGRSGTFLHYDRVNGMLRARRGARMAAITCGGAIPETANYNVVAEPDGHIVGTLDEDFAIESMAGDIFLLGTNSWQIRRVETGVVRVEDAHGAPPTIPFWNGEGLGRTIELSHEVSALRAAIDERDDAAAHALLDRRMRARQLRRGTSRRVRARRQRPALGVVPTDDTIVAERFFDEGGGMQLILHTPFGARINRAWGLGAAQEILPLVQLRTAGGGNRQRHRPLAHRAARLPARMRCSSIVKSASVEKVLTQALLPAPMFAARWRWNATRVARDPAHARRPQSAAAAPAHARRRSAGGRVSRIRPPAPKT